MKGGTKSEAVTSGRLAGSVRMQPPRTHRVIANPGTAPCPAVEPVGFSLQSTDTEDQVTSLHRGLDRCAALLSGILQGEKKDAVKSPSAATKKAAAKSRTSDSPRKRMVKKAPAPTEQKRCGPGFTSLRTRAQSVVPAAHSGVKLHPSRKHATPPSQQKAPKRAAAAAPSPRPQPAARSAPAAPEAHRHRHREEEEEEEETGPVRDNGAKSLTTDTHGAAGRSGGGANGGVAEDGGAAAEVNVETVRYLMGQLKALITGQGSVAERLLGDLEQCVLLPLMNAETSNTQTESSLRSQNAELRRCVRVLNQQLQEKAERQQNTEALFTSAFPLQEEFAAARLRLQELQGDLAELRKALGDTRSQLRDREAENALIQSELDAARSRLLDGEAERSELASIARQRLEEIGQLKRALRTCGAAVPDRSAPDTHFHHQQGALSAERPTDRVARYLTSLPEPTHEPAETSVPRLHPSRHHQTDKAQVRGRDCAEESVCSEWSAKSGSTFDTRDEAAFRDGLSALDASIASLQKTIQLDLGR